MKHFFVLSLLLSFHCVAGQPKMVADTQAVYSIDGIIQEMLRMVSIEKGRSFNREGMKRLFLPSARLTIRNHGDSTRQPVESVDLAEFLNLMEDPYYAKGYSETELKKTVQEYNGIAHVFQTFYGKDSEGAEEYGINSIQLVYFHQRWWITDLLWTNSSGGVPVPATYHNK